MPEHLPPYPNHWQIAEYFDSYVDHFGFRGRIQFQINCPVCHGPMGMGNGTATKYGMIPMPIGCASRCPTAWSRGW